MGKKKIVRVSKKNKIITTPSKKNTRSLKKKVYLNGKLITSIMVTKIEIPYQSQETEYSVQVEMNSEKKKNLSNNFTTCAISEIKDYK